MDWLGIVLTVVAVAGVLSWMVQVRNQLQAQRQQLDQIAGLLLRLAERP
jgi:hypothetical protein